MSKTYITTALRKLVYERAQGCCEYCLIPDMATLSPHEVDHVIAEKHGGQTVAENLALSCTLCNKYKGSDIASVDPDTNNIVPLFNPRIHQWHQHFKWNNGEFIALSPQGRVTIRLLRLNLRDRLLERQLLWQTGGLNLPHNSM
jgi:hypothetical protein